MKIKAQGELACLNSILKTMLADINLLIACLSLCFLAN